MSEGYSLRKRKKIVSYTEIEEPELDEFIWCDDCGDFVYEYCFIHGPLLVVCDDEIVGREHIPSYVPNAALTVPSPFLHIAPSTIQGAGLGVFSSMWIPRGVRFGPYKGDIVPNTDDCPYGWQIYSSERKPLYLVSAEDANSSNWLRYVNCSANWHEQNLESFQYQRRIYYRTIKDIPPFTELLVFYGNEYASYIGIDVLFYNAPPPCNCFSQKPSLIDSVGNYKIVNLDSGITYPGSVAEQNADEESTAKTVSIDSKYEKNKEVKETHVLNTGKIINQKDLVEISPNRNGQYGGRYKCNICRISYSDIFLLSKHVGCHSETAPHVCKECYKCYSSLVILEMHQQIHNRSYKCNVCKTIFSDKIKLEMHSKLHYAQNEITDTKSSPTSDESELPNAVLNNDVDHGFDSPLNVPATSMHVTKKSNNPKINCSEKSDENHHLRTSSTKDTDINVYKCSVCNKKLSNNSNLNTHMRLHTGEKPYECNVCHKQFNTSSHLNSHMRIHTGEKPYECNVCHKQFRHINSYSFHMRIHTGEKPYECNVCHKQFNQSYDYNRHMRIHTGEKPYECNVCHKQFNTSSHLNSHMRIHTGEKPYECNVCHKQFRHTNSYSFHMRIHTGEKPYECNVCHKQFNQSSDYNRHMRIHTGEKPYECNVCHKKFSDKSGYHIHMRIHTGEKPYECNVCHKQFNQSSDYNRPMRIHTGEKPYECNVCQKQFNQSIHLNIHMRIHTGEKPYECNVCHKKFSDKSGYHIHMRIHTGKKP